MTTTNEITNWATEAGAKVAARRAERQAAREAEAEADEGRKRLPVELFAQRFAAAAALVVEAVDHFGRVAGIAIDADAVTAGSVKLTAHSATDLLSLRRDDDRMIVEVRARSHSEETSIDLDAEAFSPETTARRISEPWCRQLEAEEAYHGTR